MSPPVLCTASAAGAGGELLVEGGGELGVVLLHQRAQHLERLLRALEVAVEVDQVGVREGLLLAGDLPGGHLVEQLLGAVADRGRRHRRVGRALGELLHVGEQLLGDRHHRGEVLVLPQRLLDPVPAGELVAGLEVGLAGVDPRVEVAEALGDGLDRTPTAAATARRAPWPARGRPPRGRPAAPGPGRAACRPRPARTRGSRPRPARPAGRPRPPRWRAATTTPVRMPSPTMPGLQATS